jgi:hypothetical protein
MKSVFSKKCGSVIFCTIMLFCISILANDAEKAVTITAKTATYGGKWAETDGNCTMIWIQKPDSTYIKTIYCGFKTFKYSAYFKTWLKGKGATPAEKLSDLDAVSAATRKNHDEVINVKWDLTDRNNKPVPNGSYEFWIEMTENDSSDGHLTHGTIDIDGTSKVTQGTTTSVLQEFKACIGDNCHSRTVPYSKKKSNYPVSIVQSGELCKINLPSTGSYSVSLISPSGKVVANNKGNGRTSTLNVNNDRLKSGVYLIKVVQSGKVYTQKNIFGF